MSKLKSSEKSYENFQNPFNSQREKFSKSKKKTHEKFRKSSKSKIKSSEKSYENFQSPNSDLYIFKKKISKSKLKLLTNFQKNL